MNTPFSHSHYLIILVRHSGKETCRFQVSDRRLTPAETLDLFLESGWFTRHGHNYYKATIFPLDGINAIGRTFTP